MTTEDDFQRALDANPEDWQTRLILADWLEERNDPRAEGYRALGAQRLYPWHNVHWYDLAIQESQYKSERRDVYSDVPQDWFALLAGGTLSGSNSLRAYENRRAAEDDAALAFAKLAPERRAELLAEPTGG